MKSIHSVYAKHIVYLGGELAKARIQLETLEMLFRGALQRYENLPNHAPWLKEIPK